jgi:hypothetical protein
VAATAGQGSRRSAAASANGSTKNDADVSAARRANAECARWEELAVESGMLAAAACGGAAAAVGGEVLAGWDSLILPSDAIGESTESKDLGEAADLELEIGFRVRCGMKLGVQRISVLRVLKQKRPLLGKSDFFRFLHARKRLVFYQHSLTGGVAPETFCLRSR